MRTEGVCRGHATARVELADRLDAVVQEERGRRPVVLPRPQAVAVIPGGECAAQRYRAVLFVVGARGRAIGGRVPVAVERVRDVLVVGVEAVRRAREAGGVARRVVRR